MQRCRGVTRGDGHGRGVRAVRCRAPPRRGSCLSSCDGSVPRGYGSGTSVPEPVPEAGWGTRRPSMVHIVWWSGWSPGRKEGYSRGGAGTAFPPRLSPTCVRIVIGMTRHRDAARFTWQFCGFAVHGSRVAGVRPREGDDGPLRRRAGARRGAPPLRRGWRVAGGRSSRVAGGQGAAGTQGPSGENRRARAGRSGGLPCENTPQPGDLSGPAGWGYSFPRRTADRQSPEARTCAISSIGRAADS